MGGGLRLGTSLWGRCFRTGRWQCPVWTKERELVVSKRPVQTRVFSADRENAIFKEATDPLFAAEKGGIS